MRTAGWIWAAALLGAAPAWACDGRARLELDARCAALCEDGGYFDMSEPQKRVPIADAKTCLYSEPWIRSIGAQRRMGTWAVPVYEPASGSATMALAYNDADARRWLEAFKQALVAQARTRLERGEGQRIGDGPGPAFEALLTAAGRKVDDLVPTPAGTYSDAVADTQAALRTEQMRLQAEAADRARWIVPQERGPFQVVPEARNYQRLLLALGARLSVDSKPGPETRLAVAAFQRRHLELGRADGVIDTATAAAIVRGFQLKYAAKHKLQPTGELDAATEAALKKVEASRRRSRYEREEFDPRTIQISAGPIKRGRLDVDTDGVRSGKCRFRDPHHDGGTSWRLDGGGSLDPCAHKFFVSPSWNDLGLFACAKIDGRIVVCGIIGDIGPAYTEASIAVHAQIGHGAEARANERLVIPVEIVVFTQGVTPGSDEATLTSQIEAVERWYRVASQ